MILPKVTLFAGKHLLFGMDHIVYPKYKDSVIGLDSFMLVTPVSPMAAAFFG